MNPHLPPAARPATSQSWRLIPLFALSIVGILLISFVKRHGAWSNLSEASVAKLCNSAYIIAGAYLVYLLVCPVVIDRVVAASRTRPLPKLLRHLVTIGIATIAGLLIAFTVAPEAFSGILALSGILGVVLGLALKPLILDVFSGISTNLDSAFQIGDWIDIGSRSDGHA
ncbi:MAG: mechanosensitive ion channel family protein, partial [Akkermansiaceae bacterium]|nr:mechanosensitive ion channel family protein [Akkermansiaceae bacterium]